MGEASEELNNQWLDEVGDTAKKLKDEYEHWKSSGYPEDYIWRKVAELTSDRLRILEMRIS